MFSLERGNRRQTLILLGMACGVAVLVPALSYLVTVLGQNIPSFPYTDRVWDYLKGWGLALSLAALILLMPIASFDRRALFTVWCVKVVVTLLAMLVYEANYAIDAYWYFERSQDRVPDLSAVGFGHGTENMSALMWYFENYGIRTSSFHFYKVLFAFFGLMGLYLFFRAVRKFRPGIPGVWLIYLGICPSMLFWSSILGKDPLGMLGICLTFYGFLRASTTKNPIYLLPAAAGLFLVSLIRLWIVPILVFPFMIGLGVKYKNVFLRLAILGITIGGLFYTIDKAGKALSIADTSQLVKNVGQVSRSWQRGGSAGDVPEIKSVGDALKFLPIGMFTALFRPLPGEVMNPFGLMAGLENVGLLVLAWRVFRRRKELDWRDPLVVWLLSYVLLWAVLYAFISPQNLGAAVRFRLQVLPQLLLLLAHLGLRPRDAAAPADDSGSTRYNTSASLPSDES